MAPEEELKQWIAKEGLSQSAFAARLKKASRKVHVDQSEVSRWLRRRRMPNDAEIRAIEKVTGIASARWNTAEQHAWSE